VSFCTPNTCANFNNESRSDTLVWVALCDSVAGTRLPFPGALNIARMGRGVIAEHDRQTCNALAADQSDLGLFAVGLNCNNGCESPSGK
jgi:hypothetical protein